MTILGVVCFATMIVAAVVVTSSALNFSQTTVTPASITLSSTGEVTGIAAGNLARYQYNAATGSALTGVTATVTITGTSTPGVVTNASVAINGVSAALPAFTAGSGEIHATVSIANIPLSATNPGSVWIVFGTAGAYTVSLVISGNA